MFSEKCFGGSKVKNLCNLKWPPLDTRYLNQGHMLLNSGSNWSKYSALNIAIPIGFTN